MTRYAPILITVLLILTSSTAALSQEEKRDKMTVVFSSSTATQAAIWLTNDAGLFEKNGLNVNLVSIRSSSMSLQTLLSGQVNLLHAGGATVVDAQLAGADLVMIAGSIREFVFQIFAKPEIQKMEDLRGKIVGVSRFGSNSDYAVRFALSHFGLTPGKDVTLLQAGGSAETLAAIFSNRLDAGAFTAPENIQARKAKLRMILDISKLQANFPFNAVIVTRAYLTNNQEPLRKFMKAYAEGISVGKKDKAFTKKVLAKYMRTQDPEILEESYGWIVNAINPQVPYPPVQGIKTLLDASTNPKAKSIKPESLVDDRLVRELDQSGFIKSLYK